MENYGEVHVLEFLRLMKAFLDKKIDAGHYRGAYFALMKKRMILSEEESRILQTAYGDADAYDPKLKLQHTIDDYELNARVSKSLAELAALGYLVEPES
jgi:uncharacterized protein YktA (UPF0223 family)